MRQLILIGVVAVAVAASGCIDASAYYDEWETEAHDDYDEWSEEDCPDEEMDEHDEHDGSGHDHGDHAELDYSGVEEAYLDADPRFHNILEGHEDSKRTITVSLRDDTLRVGLVYVFDGDVDIRLRNPLGLTVAHERVDGEKDVQEDEWYVVEDPLPGDWTLDIHLDGVGGYTLGAYVDA